MDDRERLAKMTPRDRELNDWASHKYLSRLHLEGVGESQRDFDGQTGWIVQPGSGVARLSGSMLLAIPDDASFYRDLHQPQDIYVVSGGYGEFSVFIDGILASRTNRLLYPTVARVVADVERHLSVHSGREPLSD